jgi:hypothetical protein
MCRWITSIGSGKERLSQKPGQRLVCTCRFPHRAAEETRNMSMFCRNFEQTIRNSTYDRFAVFWHFLAYLAAFRAKSP